MPFTLSVARHLALRRSGWRIEEERLEGYIQAKYVEAEARTSLSDAGWR